MSVIKIDNLTKIYKDVVAVNNLNLEINENELFSLLGINGAGKTTTIKMLTGLIKPTKGKVSIYGNTLENIDEIKKLIDISMQETAIARNLTVEENIDFFAKLNGLSEKECKEIKNYLSETFNFNNVLSKKSSKLSGGWQRKLSIALALISKPKVLFLDEPTLGLDVIARRDLWKLILKLKNNMTIILTTHYMEEAELLSDRIGIMKDGNLLFVGTKDELYLLTKKSNLEEAFLKIVEEGECNE